MNSWRAPRRAYLRPRLGAPPPAPGPLARLPHAARRLRLPAVRAARPTLPDLQRARTLHGVICYPVWTACCRA